MRVKTIGSILTTWFLVTAVLASPAGARQNGEAEVLLQAAMQRELVEGELEQAIELYRAIADGHGNNHAVAARALLYMGRSYEKLNSAEARNAYQRVVRDYADQSEMAGEARQRLAALAENAAAMSQSGIVARQLWAGGGEVDVTATPSPDGRYLFSVDMWTGDLAMREVATGNIRHLTHEKPLYAYGGLALYPVLSPDGNTVVTAWFNEEYFWELRLVGINGDSVRTLYRNEDVYWVAPVGWTPDGSQVLTWFERKDGTNQIVMVSVEDGSARTLKSFDWRVPSPNLSPDGRFIAYDFPPHEDLPQKDIYLLAADGSREVSVVEHPANDFSPIWAPDGSGILFLSDRTGTSDAWFLEMEEGRPKGSPRLVKRNLGSAITRGFTDDGSLVYSVRGEDKNVFILTLDSSGRIEHQATPVILRSEGSNARADWSPDGKHLVFRRGFGPENSTVLVIHSLETGQERELVFRELRYDARPRWSPDGKSILIQGKDRQQRESIYLLDLESGELTQMLRGGPDLHYRNAVWGPEGRTILYEVRHGDSDLIQLVARNLDTGNETILHTASSGISDLALSPDAKSIAFRTGRRQHSVFVMSITGEEPREVFTAPEGGASIHGIVWMKNGQDLLFAMGHPDGREPDGGERERSEYRLWRVPLAGGQPENLGPITKTGRAVDLRLHPDGHRLVFTADKGYVAEVWMLEKLLAHIQSGQ